jgi:hypothetical protein
MKRRTVPGASGVALAAPELQPVHARTRVRAWEWSPRLLGAQ